jgi:hypothetical protein
VRVARWWWTATVILVPVLAGTVVSVVLLLALVDVDTARDRIELIKTGLAIGAGTGGVAALVLAGRRQWSTEQANRATERSFSDSRHDAAERRITDLYSKAADQLGSDKAAVRLAGLYSLERLAQDTPPLRQTIVNVLCAYLRMPTVAGDEEPEVRRTAQTILRGHLRPGRPDDFWPGVDLDLARAVLDHFDMSDTRVRRAYFGAAEFVGWTTFESAHFERFANFGGARFRASVNFASVHFGNTASFTGARFDGPAQFDGATFAGPARFGGKRARSVEDLPDGAVFAGTASFTGVTFSQPPVFDHVQATFPLPG